MAKQRIIKKANILLSFTNQDELILTLKIPCNKEFGGQKQGCSSSTAEFVEKSKHKLRNNEVTKL